MIKDHLKGKKVQFIYSKFLSNQPTYFKSNSRFGEFCQIYQNKPQKKSREERDEKFKATTF